MKSFNFVSAAAAFALAACASLVHIDQPSQVIVGKTTMAEVDQLMGHENRVVINKRTRERVYEYNYKDEWGNPAKLALLYDDHGVVARKSTESIDKD